MTDLAKKHAEWVWKRCPGCGRVSKYANDPRYPGGDFHSDGCPLEGVYGHTQQWWFERELEKAEAELARIREGNVTVCEDTGQIARDGVCPAHEGDACLVIPAAYVGQLRALRADVVRAEAALKRLGPVEALAREVCEKAAVVGIEWTARLDLLRAALARD